MKKVLFALLAGVAMISCSKDNQNENKENGENQNSDITGVWYHEGISINNVTTEFGECQKKSTTSFSEGKFKTIVYFGFGNNCSKMSETDGIYTVSGNRIETKWGGLTYNAEFSISGNTLTMKYDKDDKTLIYKKK